MTTGTIDSTGRAAPGAAVAGLTLALLECQFEGGRTIDVVFQRG